MSLPVFNHVGVTYNLSIRLEHCEITFNHKANGYIGFLDVCVLDYIVFMVVLYFYMSVMCQFLCLLILLLSPTFFS